MTSVWERRTLLKESKTDPFKTVKLSKLRPVVHMTTSEVLGNADEEAHWRKSTSSKREKNNSQIPLATIFGSNSV